MRGDVFELSRAECLQLISGGGVGRVAYTDRAMPAITPVSFALDAESVVFRTEVDGRLAAGTDGAVVAFEVDDLDLRHHRGWSVVVVGLATGVDRPSAQLRAMGLGLSPWLAGRRDRFVRISATDVTGRWFGGTPVPGP